MSMLKLIKPPCPYCGDTSGECQCREFMALLDDMTPEEKQRLEQFMAALRSDAADP